MLRHLSIIFLAVVLVTIANAQETAVIPPTVAKKAHELTAHGDVRQDEYYWLRERENPEVIAYLNAENEYMLAS